MIDIATMDFVYNATIKLGELPSCKARMAFPGVSDLALNSRHFSTYVECVNSAKGLMEDVIKDVNLQKDEEYTVSAEVNPAQSGIATRSRDWGDDELARLWIFNKKQAESARIHAVGQARIFALARTEPAPLLN